MLGGPFNDGNEGEDDARFESDNGNIDQAEGNSQLALLYTGDLGVIKNLWDLTDLCDL